MLTNWYKICLAIYPTHIQFNSLVSYHIQTFVSSSLTIHDFLFQTRPFKISFLINLVISLLVYQAFLILHWATLFNRLFYLIRSFRVYQTIPQDSSTTPKIHWIIWLASGYLDLLLCTEPARSLSSLYEFASELQG